MAETISSSYVNCSWYNPETGIYSSKHPKIQLPTNPFHDIVSHIFSYQNNYNNSCLIDSSTGYSIPYSKIFSLVKSISFGLHEMGLSKGDVVLIMLPNSVYLPIIYWGVLHLGGIIAPMSPLSSFSEVEKQAHGCHAKMAFTLCCEGENENSHDFSTLGLKKVIHVPKHVTLLDQHTHNNFADFFRLLNNNNVGRNVSNSRPSIRQDDTAAILCSSGTTGGSKGVILTHRNLIAMVELFVRFEASQYSKDMIKSHENVYLAVLPMFHIYGLAHFGFGLITLGTSVVVMSKYDINEVVKVIHKYNVTHFPTVPPLIAALTNKVRSLSASDLSSLKQVSCGAAPITTRAISDFLRSFPGVDFIQGYGMTESTAVGTRGFNQVIGDHTNNKYTSAGLLAPNMEAKVVSLSTRSCMPPGKHGELLLRGPGVMKGYLNNEEATRMAIQEDGWLHTGDIAYFDHDGYLYIVDRLKDMIKHKGFQIAPADLEAILMSHPDIIDVAVTGVAVDEVGEIPVAFVIKRPGSLLSRNEVIKYVANMVAPHKKVREVVFVTSFPKSATGKVLKRLLKNLLPSKL